MADEDPALLLKAAILVPSIVSFIASFFLALVIIIYRARQTTLSKFVFSMALSDLLYTFMGIFFTSDRYFQRCPSFLSSTREYTRLISCNISIAFAYTTSLLAKDRTDVSHNTMNKLFFFALASPLVFISIFLVFYQHEYLDILCWDAVREDPEANQGVVEYILKLPLLGTFCTTFLFYYNIIIYTKRRMENEGNNEVSRGLYQLLVYPLGILICYLWFFIDEFNFDYGFIRIIDIVSQQLQGLINFLIFGMNYQTRTQMKDYWQRISGLIYEFFHLREKEREVEIELQSMPLNSDFNNQEKFQVIQYR